MSLATLFYLKETFRENVRQWRQACFRRRRQLQREQRFVLESLEPRVLLSATPTEVVTAAQPIEPAAVTVPAGTLPSLDVDLNGQADALTDGILIIRHLFGFSGSALTNGAVDPAGQRTDPAAIATYLEAIRPSLDVDLNQQADALTDGILIIRNLFGFTGSTLTTGAIDPVGGRVDPGIISTFLDNMNPQREHVAPLVTAGLQQDTGLSASDTITFNPAFSGTVADINQIASFTAGFDTTPIGSFVNVLADLQATGNFTLSTSRLNQLAGGTLADGAHTLHLRITDAQGNLASLDRIFTLDTTRPSATFNLVPGSDSAPVGDFQTLFPVVSLAGQTEPNAGAAFVQGSVPIVVGQSGAFTLANIPLALGGNALTIRVTDQAGNIADITQTFTRLLSTNQPPVLSAIGNQTVRAGELLRVTTGVTDADVPAQSFTFSLVGTVPQGVSIGGANGVLTWTPTVSQIGQTSITIRVEDSGLPALSDEKTFTVTVTNANQAPVLAPVAAQAVFPGGHLEIQFNATDPDGDRVSYFLQSTTSLLTSMLRSDGTLVVTPAPGEEGTYQFTVVASDGVLTSSRPVTLTVAPDPNATTRISGTVVGTTGQPLAGVPIEVGRIITLTDAQGHFTLDLPAILVPTASLNIAIPTGDIYFDPFSTGTQFISMRRAGSDPASGTSTTNLLEHPNLVTSFLDGSMVYGSDPNRALALRTLQGGKLKTSAGNLLPFNSTAFFSAGPLENDNGGNADPGSLFVAGDVRASENVALEALHTVFLREHNRLADQIAQANPGFTDEQVYQAARRMLIGELQHIVYSEYLPVLLGSSAIPAYTGYQAAVDPSASAIFATAAFRFGHSQMVSSLLQLDAGGNPLPGGPLNLRDAFFTTAPIAANGVDPILRGLIAQQAQDIDTHVIDELRNFLFGPPGSGGQDLVSLNIQRGRDLGLPGYTQARLDFGLSPVTSFSQITGNVTVQQQLQSIYGTVDKIDAWVGGLAEDHAPGALLGPLFQKIIADQFQRTRAADRFWYENGQFTASDLAQIRATTFGDLIARNTGLTNLPAHVFTTGTVPAAPAPAGTAAAATPADVRSITGAGNNQTTPTLGETGTNLKTNFTVSYGDGISTPGGADRPGAREISNAVFPQTGSIPNTSGVTALAVFFGQILDHDISLTATGITDTIKIHGDQANPAGIYPFVAEKLPLMLGHQVYAGLNNVIARPIFLPAIDTANAATIDPTRDVTVTTTAIPGASVAVAAGTLEDREGNMFAGQLSITQVPATLTPASLPPGLNPDLVVTIQPADMVFSNPAPLSLPNTGGFAPGTIMDLWSINPLTGQFDNVGKGQVSQDGTVIETVDGGVRNSSWHFFAPPPAPNPPEDHSEECEECNAAAGFNSNVELGSGAVIEAHSLPTYQSLGVERGVLLVYDSLRADPNQIVQIGQDAVQFDPAAYFVGKLEIGHRDEAGAFTGFTAGGGVMPGRGDTGWNFWKVPDFGSTAFGAGIGNLDAALLADMSQLPTGLYDYRATYGLQTFRPQETIGTTLFPERFIGSTSSFWGDLVSVNESASPFGSGWGIAGLQKLVTTGLDVILVDGNGSHLLYRAKTTGEVGTFNTGADHRTPIATSYTSPPGHFATLLPLFQDVPSGSGFERRLIGYRQTSTDQTVSTFDADGRLRTVTDRVGNQTTYEYDPAGRVVRIVDPVGLTTTLTYVNGRAATIIDPAGRLTRLEYDAAGNLTRITNPDNTARQWTYDGRHHMIGETDARGYQEQSFYDFAGRAASAVLKDGNRVTVKPLDVRGLSDPRLTADWHTAPTARDSSAGFDFAEYIQPNGNVVTVQLDAMGQALRSFDSLGLLSATVRNADNLVSETTDSLGHVTHYTYDALGNLTSVRDELSGGSRVSGTLTPDEPFTLYSLTIDHYTNLFFDSLTNRSDITWTLFGGQPALAGQPLVLSRPFSSAAPLPMGGSRIMGLLEPGAYTLFVQGSVAAPESFSFRLIDADQAIPIPFGAPVSGTLAPGNEGDLYRFDGAAGDRFAFDAIGSSGFSAPVTWQLVDEGGVPVFTQNFSDLASVTVPVTGTYTVLIEGDIAETTASGVYSFSVQKIGSGPPAPSATPLAFGTTVAGAIGQPGEIDRFSFEVQPGTLVYFDDLGTGTSIHGALQTPRLGSTSIPVSAGLPDGILRNLPGPGTYTLALSGVSNATGPYQFRLLNLAVATPVTSGASVSGTLAPGFETDSYAVQVPTDGAYQLDVTVQPAAGLTIPPVLRLIDQEGNLLQSATLPGPGQSALHVSSDFVFGTVYILIEGADGESSASGSYSFTPTLRPAAIPPVSNPGPQQITVGALVSGQVAGPGESDQFVVQGTFGQRMLFAGISSTSSGLGIQIPLAQANTTFTAGTVVGPFTFTQDGGTFITVGGSLATAGTYSFRVLDLANARPLQLGAVRNGQINVASGVDMLSFTGTAGQRVTLNSLSASSPAARWRLIAPNDAVLASGLLSEDLGPFTLTLNGTYVLLLESGGSPSPVSYSVQVDVVNPVAVTPSGFTVISGSVTVLDTYQVTASAGTLLYLDDLGFSGVQVSIIGPGSEVVAIQGFLSGGFTPVFLPESGTYTLQISPFFPGTFGNPYQFHIRNLTADAASIAIGNAVSHSFGADAEDAAYRITVSAGQRLYFDQLVPAGSSLQRTLFAEDGTSISFFDVHRFVLPGTYYLLLENSAAQPNTFDFRLLDLATAPAVLLDRSIQATSNGLDAQLYRFDVPSPQTARVTPLSTNGVTTAKWGITDGSTSSGLNQFVTAAFDEDVQAGTQWLIVDGDQGVPFTYSFSMALMPTPAPAFPQIINLTPTHGQDNQATGNGMRFTYDPVFSQVTSIVDDLGHVTLFDIDPANGNVRSITNVVGAVGGTDDIVRQFTYTTQGLVDLEVDPLGRVTDYDYDARGRLIRATFAKGTADQGVLQFEYDQVGNIAAAIDENGHRAEFVYDAMNRLTLIRDESGHESSITYDAGGNAISTRDARQHTTSFSYDALDRLLSMMNADGAGTSYTYDRGGNLSSTVDPVGRTTMFLHDLRNRLTEQRDALGGRTDFAYDAADNLVGVIDPDGNQTAYQYDARRRLIEEIDPLGNETRYQYNGLDRLIGLVDRNDHFIAYAYDDVQRLISERWLSGQNTIAYTYDLAGNLLTAADQASSLSFTYDNRDRYVTVDNGGLHGVPHVLLAYGYDAAGNVLSVTDSMNGVQGGVTAYLYDALDRTTRITQSGAGVSAKRVDVGYDEIGQITSIGRFADAAGNVKVAESLYTYDALNRMTGIVHQTGANLPLAQVALTYDAVGRVTKLTDADGTTDYTYDQLSRLAGADHSAQGNQDETYQYDANGNRTSSHLAGQGYQTAAGNRVTTDGTFDYLYDGRGNLLRRTTIASGAVREFGWDDRSRLVEVDDRSSSGGAATQTVTFAYDVFNRRISKTVDADGAGPAADHVDYFIYDGADVLMEFRDPDGVGGAAPPVLSQRNLFGPGTDNLLATQDGAGNTRWMLADHQGSVRDIVDNSGAVVNHITYDSFGNVVAQSNAAQSGRYLYTGREFDRETGLYYYRSRYYDASLGRFISEDPIGFMGRDLNLYRYVGGDPVRFRDPDGLAPNINLLSPSQAPAASALPSSSVYPVVGAVGEFTVTGHGTQAGDGIAIYETNAKGEIVYERNAKGEILRSDKGEAIPKIKETLNADKVADLIKKHKDYRPGQKVRLFVCNSGNKLAGEVAKKLEAQATGPNGEIKIIQGVDRAIPDPGVKWISVNP